MDNADEATRPAMQEAYGKAAAKLRAQNAEYKQFCEDNGLKTRQDRVSIAGWDRKQAAQARAAENALKKELANSVKKPIMNVDTGGHRNEVPLTEEQIAEAKNYAITLGMRDDGISYRDGYHTSYGETFDILCIGTDVMPSTHPTTANEAISMRGSIAHEIVGHRDAHMNGWTQSVKWYEEAQASIRAARFAPGLSNSERYILLRDANERLVLHGERLSRVKSKLHIERR